MTKEDLFGMKINMSLITEFDPVRQRQYQYYNIDDIVMLEKIKKLAPVTRIILPGQSVTSEKNMTRLNIYVNENGIINKVVYG